MFMRVACLAAVASIITVSSANAQSIIDLNGDGVADILLQDSSSKAVAAWLMNVDGEPTEFVSVGSGAKGAWTVQTFTCQQFTCGPANDDGPWTVVGTRDVTSDGVADILLQSSSSAVMAWVMSAAGQPTRAVTVTLPTFYCFGDVQCVSDFRWKVVAVADLDSDGLTDLVFQSPWEPGRPSAFGGPGGVRTVLLDQQGHVKPGGPRTVAEYDMGGWQVVGAADVNHDGISDLLLQYTNGLVAAWLMNGTSEPADFVWIWPYESGGWQLVGTLDLNHDGTLDVVLQYGAGHVGVWLMNQAGEPVDFVLIWPYEAGPWRVNGRSAWIS